MKEEREKREFEEDFPMEEIEILGIIGANGWGGGRAGKELLWTVWAELVDWRRNEQDAPLEGEGFSLTAKADNEALASLRSSAKPETIIQTTVRISGKKMLVCGEFEVVKDDLLAERLEEYQRPVYYHDAQMGTFELNRGIGIFEKEIFWKGEKVDCSFDQEEGSEMKKSLEVLHRLLQEMDGWHRRITEGAASCLLELKNDSWIDDDEEPVTTKEFIQKMSLCNITVESDGEFSFWFDDGDLFWGHSIVVSGDLSNGVTDATIEG